MLVVDVPVSMRALIQRINRKLAHEEEMLKTTRGARAISRLGRYYRLNVNRNFVIDTRVDPVALARELGVLNHYEVVVEDDAS